MGKCLSPSCSDIVMSELPTIGIEKLLFKVPFFVDDIIISVSYDEIVVLLQTFNNFHHKLQFTAEKENNNFIPFL